MINPFCPRCLAFVGDRECPVCAMGVPEHLLIYQLMTAWDEAETNENVADRFLLALGLPGRDPQQEDVRRLIRLIGVAISIAAKHSLIAKGGMPIPKHAIWVPTIDPEWTPAQVKGVQCVAAAMNLDVRYVADMIVSGTGECCLVHSIERLLELLTVVVGIAVDAAKIAQARHSGPS